MGQGSDFKQNRILAKTSRVEFWRSTVKLVRHDHDDKVKVLRKCQFFCKTTFVFNVV